MTERERYLFLFADLEGNTSVAEERSLSYYTETYLSSFYVASYIANQIISDFTDIINFSGDELNIFIEIDAKKQEKVVIDSIAFVYYLKLLWLGSSYNIERLENEGLPRELNCGIHIGLAKKIMNPCTNKKDLYGGLHINIAKRIQQEASNGEYTKIYVSTEIKEDFENWYDQLEQKGHHLLKHCKFSKRDQKVSVKNISKPFSVYELKLNNQLKLDCQAIKKKTKESAEKISSKLKDNSLNKYKTEIINNIEKWPDSLGKATQLFADSMHYLNCYFISNIYSHLLIKLKDSLNHHKELTKKYKNLITKLEDQLKKEYSLLKK